MQDRSRNVLMLTWQEGIDMQDRSVIINQGQSGCRCHYNSINSW
ncbi:hypothetical protein ANCCAN_13357 [Ancylostoma caninum]|uniref:Uncharacterized protein n=1 Tax=Ancylostoma caninum TaxID=29170 RepID=A0A368G8G8_ANCCA|nr:hypothetical protein ANCCAN_13357 [Ancylostoma caninum]